MKNFWFKRILKQKIRFRAVVNIQTNIKSKCKQSFAYKECTFVSYGGITCRQWSNIYLIVLNAKLLCCFNKPLWNLNWIHWAVKSILCTLQFPQIYAFLVSIEIYEIFLHPSDQQKRSFFPNKGFHFLLILRPMH